MDILDVGLTIKEFKMEWTIKYTPNDITFWAPLLDSDLPVQKLCAFELFLAWGRESVIEAYMKWEDCRSRRAELSKEYEAAKKEHWDNFNPDYYHDDDTYHYVSYSNGIRRPVRSLSAKDQHTAKFRKYYNNTDWEISQLAWPEYFKAHVFGKGLGD